MVVGPMGPGEVSRAGDHALVKEITESDLVEKVYWVGANAAAESMEKVVPIHIHQGETFDHAAERIIAIAKERGIDFVVPRPEAPLFQGIGDRFEAAGIPFLGPCELAAEYVERRKSLCKRILGNYGIRTAPSCALTRASHAKEYLSTHFKGRVGPAKLVLKPDYQADGKNVTIVDNYADACDAVDVIMSPDTQGGPDKPIVIEYFLPGYEASLIGIVDETGHAKWFILTQDYKVVNGEMTGGTGARTMPEVPPELFDAAVRDIGEPFIAALREEGIPYTGIIYFGLMFVEEEGRVVPYTLEVNCRWGDPEAEVILSMLKTDIVKLYLACRDNRLSELPELEWHDGEYVAVVVMAGGYPGKIVTDVRVYRDDAQPAHTQYFVGGTRFDQAGNEVVASGRVGVVGAWAPELVEACRRAMIAANRVSIGDPDPLYGTQFTNPQVGIITKP